VSAVPLMALVPQMHSGVAAPTAVAMALTMVN
jgi:hypothetical protein